MQNDFDLAPAGIVFKQDLLGDKRSLRDLLIALRGRSVQLLGSDGSAEAGILVGLDEVEDKPLEQSLVSILREGTDTVTALPLSRIAGVELHDETAAADLRFFLQTALGQETHRSIDIRLSPGSHDLEVSYIAPAPTWRVSYRLVMDEEGEAKAEAEAEEKKALLQGWGIFDNRLEEDLTDISLSLTAGMPISFVYDLYTPHTPKRPVVQDENRVAAGPIMFEATAELHQLEDMAAFGAVPAPAMARAMMKTERRKMSLEEVAASVQSAATGQAVGELFQYNVGVPVTVGRGQSAMVPIVSSTLGCKKDLIYNGSKMPTHPVATLRFKNETDLTLERGPVTVLENGEYVGEAVLPFTTDRAEAVISYAVELGVHVKEEIKSESQLQSLRIKDDYFLENSYDITRKIYRVDNRTAQPKTVLIEYNLGGDYLIFDTSEPEEKTLETYRYKVDAPAGKIVEFVVQARYLLTRRERLRNLSYQGLQRYFADKLLDQKAYDGLRALLDVWAEISGLEKAIADQEQQRGKIYRAQEQAQKNMAVLSNAGEEGKLRGRYVKQLTESEEQLTEIDRTVARLQTEIEQKQAHIERMIAALGAG